MRASFLALASGVAAQNLSTVTGQSAIPASVQAPSIAGFSEATIHLSRGGLAVCVSGKVPVQATTTKNVLFKLQVPANQSVVTQIFVNAVTSGSPFTKEIVNGTSTVSGKYDIKATYCTPATNLKPSTVQILSHGIGFDRQYWDFAPGYSYVDVAASYGHASFFYDRLGVGESSKPDDNNAAINVVQAPLEVEILQSLITTLKSGGISNTTFGSVVGVGHSFGSILTGAILSQYPTSLNTAILTGFSINSTGMPIFLQGLNLAIAAQNQPSRFGGLSNGYLVSSTIISNQIAFLHAQNFDPAILNLAEATKGSVTFGELLTVSSVVTPAINFAGSVAVVNGDDDLPFCTGNCSYPVNLAQSALVLFPVAKNKGTYLAPLTGHGLNLHYSAVAAYQYIQQFIANSTAA